MKRNSIHIILCLTMALQMFLLQSCLKDDEKVYGDEAGDRVEKYLTNAKSVLTSAEHGWHLSYFPHRQLKYGGFNYALKFTDDDNVTVWYEEEPGVTHTSTYAMVGDDGPVLSFDTYNEFMHYYAKPSQGEYEAKDGDFEFILLEVTENKITLKGKRSGNIMYMTRLEVPAATYMQKLEDAKALYHIYGGGTATVDGEEYSAVFDMQNRRLTINNPAGESIATRTYIFTEKGIQLADTIKVGSTIMKDFIFNSNTDTFEASGVSFALENTFKNYNEFIGTYTIKELGKTVTIKADTINKTYIVSGLTYMGTPIAHYDSYWGNIYFSPQWLDSWSTTSYPEIHDWLVIYDGDLVYFDNKFKSTSAVAPGKKIQFSLGSNGMTIMEWAFTKKNLSDGGNESLGDIEEYPMIMTWIKK